MSEPSRRTVAVVGGGVIGVSTAQQLARSGMDTVLITEGELASNASGWSLSWLNSAGLRSEAYHRLRMVGIDRYRTLAARRRDAAWLRFDGGLRWQSDQDELRRIHIHENSLGYDSVLLPRERVEAEVPGVDPTAVPATGALANAGEGWVDLPSLMTVLVDDLLARGGRVLTHAGRAVVEVERGRVSAVRTADGEQLTVGAALLATGPDVPKTAAGFGVSIPDATQLALLVHTRPLDAALRVVLNTPQVALRPSPDGALAVDADWTRPSIRTAEDGSHSVDREVVEELLGEACRVLSGHPALVAESYGIVRKPIPGDGEPVVGQLGDVDGLYVAFTHSGATLALVLGELLAQQIVTGGEAHPLLSPFTPKRFG